MLRHLPDFGVHVDVLAADESGVDFSTDTAARGYAERRALIMGRVGVALDPAFKLAGLRPEAFPPSTVWAVSAARGVRRRLQTGRYDAVVATGPPWAALLAGALARPTCPLIVELRDLWASNPLFDRGGPVLSHLERYVLARAAATIVVTPEAALDVRRRHPGLRRRTLHVVENGFEPDLLTQRSQSVPGSPLRILHSGSLTVDRPLAPLLAVLAEPGYREAFTLEANGVVAPRIRAEIERSGVNVAISPPVSWEMAVERIASCDIALITQSAAAGDETAVAGKAYEYLALGRPVLCLTAGGATEALLARLGQDAGCARLDDAASIRRALDRLRVDPPAPATGAVLAPYDRRSLAQRLAAIIEDTATPR